MPLGGYRGFRQKKAWNCQHGLAMLTSMPILEERNTTLTYENSTSMNWALTLNSGGISPLSTAACCRCWIPMNRCSTARGTIPTSSSPSPLTSNDVPMVYVLPEPVCDANKTSSQLSIIIIIIIIIICCFVTWHLASPDFTDWWYVPNCVLS